MRGVFKRKVRDKKEENMMITKKRKLKCTTTGKIQLVGGKTKRKSIARFSKS